MHVSTTSKNFYSESVARSFQSTVVWEFVKIPFLGPDARVLECAFCAPFCSCALSCEPVWQTVRRRIRSSTEKRNQQPTSLNSSASACSFCFCNRFHHQVPSAERQVEKSQRFVCALCGFLLLTCQFFRSGLFCSCVKFFGPGLGGPHELGGPGSLNRLNPRFSTPLLSTAPTVLCYTNYDMLMSILSDILFEWISCRP